MWWMTRQVLKKGYVLGPSRPSHRRRPYIINNARTIDTRPHSLTCHPSVTRDMLPASDKENDVNRRQFIRIMGGGTVVAASGPMMGCSGTLPEEAVAAWKGAGQETDVRRWLLSYAILAPHSHNLQSWLVDLREPDEIVLRCDRDRLLPETDPFSRQIMMSHGTFLELMNIAAHERGLRAEITLFPEGVYPPNKIDERPVARVKLIAGAAARKDPLFAQILKRRTNRNAYDLARPIPAAAWQSMADAVKPYPLPSATSTPARQRHFSGIVRSRPKLGGSS